METVTPDLKYLSLSDHGDTYELLVEDTKHEISKRTLQKYFKGTFKDLSQEHRHAILHRDFDFTQSRTLHVVLKGGIGDIIVGFECLLALKERIRLEAGAEFAWVAEFNPGAHHFFRRFLDAFPLVDWVYTPELAEPIRFPFKTLTGASIDVGCARIAIGSAWDVLLAKWGIPGRYAPATVTLPSRLEIALRAEFDRLRKSRNFPEAAKYVLFSPQGRYLAELKSWPNESWKTLQDLVLAESPYQILLLGREESSNLASDNDRVFFHDHEKEPHPNDFLTLLALVANAAAVVSVDSGPAISAGFLRRPCIALFGPTSPIHYGHPNNINVRLSACPPCSTLENAKLCTANVCMREIPADEIFKVLMKLREGKK